MRSYKTKTLTKLDVTPHYQITKKQLAKNNCSK